jgi:hypothetical protein
MYPERLHVVALAIDVTTQLLETIHSFFNDAADRVTSWPSTTDISITPDTRQRLERIQSRPGVSPSDWTLSKTDEDFQHDVGMT